MNWYRLPLLAAMLFMPALAQRVGEPTDDLTKLGVDGLISAQATSVGRKAQKIQLTITRRLVNLMGGQLRVKSEPGQGSCFVVELPLASCAAPEPRESAAVLPATAGELRILVAEDNVINQKVISAMLRRQGWTVTLAAPARRRDFISARAASTWC